MPSRIILCPGQGAQAVGMAKKWFDASPLAREVFAAADRILGSRLGSPLSELCFGGPAERLNQTDAAQPAIYTASVACWRATLSAWNAGPRTNGSNEAGVFGAAGLSLGEYTALHIAGCFSFEEGLELVALRGRAMQDAATAVPSGMVALIGADEAQAQSVCDAAREDGVLVCANFNAPGQVVLSGDKPACERAVSAAAGAGLRAQPLPVAGAFHSPIMAPAAERLGAALARTPVAAPRCRVYSNVTAAPHQADAAPGGSGTIEQSIRARLIEQLTSPVRWAQSCTRLVGDAPQGSTWHELAPGKTLAGLLRRIDKNVKVESHDEPPAPIQP
jgi:[acyl-carrier-protein] S-malonyltransferase